MAWRNPTPTVDVVVVRDGPQPAVLVIRRKNPPHGWALPGGFVDEGERVETAAVREVREEASLDVALTHLLHVYSDPARDPRKHTMSVVFEGTVPADARARAADDAAEVQWLPVDELERTLDKLPFAFDHAEILSDWLRFRATGERPALKVSVAQARER